MAVRKSNLEIKTSLIPGAGNGLFTKVKIKNGTIIGVFEGEIIPVDESDNRPESDGWFVELENDLYLDCYPIHSEAKYANDVDGIVKIKDVFNNSEICCYDDDSTRVYLISNMDIEKGSEIYCSYGEQYWDDIKKKNGNIEN